MATVPTVNLDMVRGNSLSFTITVTQAGAAFNLTGSSVRMTAKQNYSDLDAAKVFALTVGAGITLTTPLSGLATVVIPASATTGLPPNPVNLFYDIKVTDASSNPYTVVRGTLTVLPDVSITTP